jgi:hypothetical protein
VVFGILAERLKPIEMGGAVNSISTSIRSNIDILLDNFPEIIYFLDQENE